MQVWAEDTSDDWHGSIAMLTGWEQLQPRDLCLEGGLSRDERSETVQVVIQQTIAHRDVVRVHVLAVSGTILVSDEISGRVQRQGSRTPRVNRDLGVAVLVLALLNFRPHKR